MIKEKMYEEHQSKECKQILRKHNLNPIKKLGKGAFGLVYLVSQTDFTTYETSLFSVKCTNKKNFVRKPILRRYLKQQIMLLEEVSHSNVVKLTRTFQDEGWIFMIMEYCDRGNLAHVQNQKANRVFSFPEFKKIINDIIEGLAYMHSKNIIHRDIKPENILLTKNHLTDEIETKICDLGFARQTEDAETFCGTTYFMAPEIFQKKKYNNRVDIWSLGVLIFYMLYGNHPFKSINMLIDIQSKCENGFNMQNIKKIENLSMGEEEEKLIKQLLRDIFVLDPEKRISLQQIKDKLNINLDQKDMLKETASSEVSQQSCPQFYLQQIKFINNVWKEVKEIGFLTHMEELALKYYLDKVCLNILSENGSKSEENCHLISKLLQSQTTDSISLVSNVKEVGIKKFSQFFSTTSQIEFRSFKEAYRLVVGHAFYKAHKMIKDQKLKNQIKLKLFCCHAINRVFEKGNVKDVFGYYFDWMQQRKKGERFSLLLLEEWIGEQKVERIMGTVEIINNKFYKKKK